MNSGKLLIAMGAAFFLLSGRAMAGAPHAQVKVDSASETLHASAKPPPRAKSEVRGRAQKRSVHHDATLDYPQLG
jgi:hypothetical protein